MCLYTVTIIAYYGFRHLSNDKQKLPARALGTLVSTLSGRSALCSAARGLLAVPRMRGATAQSRSFAYVGPSSWNHLPHELRLSLSGGSRLLQQGGPRGGRGNRWRGQSIFVKSENGDKRPVLKLHELFNQQPQVMTQMETDSLC